MQGHEQTTQGPQGTVGFLLLHPLLLLLVQELLVMMAGLHPSCCMLLCVLPPCYEAGAHWLTCGEVLLLLLLLLA
jgi:hypothetical protein